MTTSLTDPQLQDLMRKMDDFIPSEHDAWIQYFCEHSKDKTSAQWKLVAELFKRYALYDVQNNPRKSKYSTPPTEFDIDEVAELYLKWTIEHYFGSRIKQIISQFEKLHDSLPDAVTTYNDLDNHVFKVQCGTGKKAIAIESQNFRFLYVLNNSSLLPKFHIRRYWDAYPQPKRKCTYAHFLAHLDWAAQYYSDCVKGNKYIKRPTLEWFVKNFLVCADKASAKIYSDCRDAGYVASYDVLLGRIDYVNSASEISIALLEFAGACGEFGDIGVKP